MSVLDVLWAGDLDIFCAITDTFDFAVAFSELTLVKKMHFLQFSPSFFRLGRNGANVIPDSNTASQNTRDSGHFR